MLKTIRGLAQFEQRHGRGFCALVVNERLKPNKHHRASSSGVRPPMQVSGMWLEMQLSGGHLLRPPISESCVGRHVLGELAACMQPRRGAEVGYHWRTALAICASSPWASTCQSGWAADSAVSEMHRRHLPTVFLWQQGICRTTKGRGCHPKAVVCLHEENSPESLV